MGATGYHLLFRRCVYLFAVTSPVKRTVLVLAGMELIFFTAASMWLGFGFVLKNSVDNTGMFSLSLSSACTVPRAVLLRIAPHQHVGWGAQEAGAWPGQPTPTHPRDTPHPVTLCSACKAGRRGRKGGHLGRWRLSSRVTDTRDGALLCRRWLPTRSSE